MAFSELMDAVDEWVCFSGEPAAFNGHYTGVTIFACIVVVQTDALLGIISSRSGHWRSLCNSTRSKGCTAPQPPITRVGLHEQVHSSTITVTNTSSFLILFPFSPSSACMPSIVFCLTYKVLVVGGVFVSFERKKVSDGGADLTLVQA